MNITEDFCSFEVAKLLKEKGFNVPCLAHWHIGNDGHKKFSDYPFNWNEKVKNDLGWLSCPTHQMAMKWLREVHNISIEPFVDYGSDDGYWCTVDISYIKKDGLIITLAPYNTYEDAVEEALKYCIENLI